MPILDEDLDKTRAIFETNVWGPVAVTQAFAPLLIEAKGQVVFITSISGYVNVPWMGEYICSDDAFDISRFWDGRHPEWDM